MSEDIPIHDLVSSYRALRAAIAEEEEAYEAKLTPIKAELDIVSAELLKFCNEQDVDSIKTPAGTVSRRVQTRYWTTDWERMYEFIRENDVPFLLEQRIHNGNMKQFLDENPDSLPIGLQADRKFVIQVRKPTGK